MLPADTFIVGRHLYGRCGMCRKIVRLTGFLARWHLCVTDEEIAAATHARLQQIRATEVAQQMTRGGLLDQSTLNRLTQLLQ